MSIRPWKRIEPTTVTRVGYRTMVEKHFKLDNGLVVDRVVMNEDGWLAVDAIAITTDNKVIIAQQFRPGPEKIMDELPGGIVDAGEKPEQAMVRELAEETGYQPGAIEYLGVCHYDAYVNGERHYFLLTGCTPLAGGAHTEEDEQVEVRLVTIEELLAIAKRGGMTDPGGLWLAYDKLMELAKKG
jgi:ADP-ribose pyrophosphatase